MFNDKNTCPLCGNTVIYDGGYLQCQDPACGWNKALSIDISRDRTNKVVIKGKVIGKYILISKAKVSKSA